MNRIDKMIAKAENAAGAWRADRDNPYMGMASSQLLAMMDGRDYQAPEKGTLEWDHFIYALIHAENVGGLEEVAYTAEDRMMMEHDGKT